MTLPLRMTVLLPQIMTDLLHFFVIQISIVQNIFCHFTASHDVVLKR